MNLSRHRNLYNGDSTFLFVGSIYNPRGKDAPYTAEVFHRFIDLIADSGIDTYIQNPNAQVPWYPSKALPNIITGYTRSSRAFTRGHYPPPVEGSDFAAADLEKRIDWDNELLNHYLDLAEAGVDWVAEIATACRRRGVSPWVSVRMNDLHGANSWEHSYMNSPMQRNPAMRLSARDPNPRDGVNQYQQGHSYAFPETRDYYLTMIRELVNDYDYEGLELDWMRQPFAYEPPATRAQCDELTAWIAEVRDLTQVRGKKRGKQYPLGVRCPVRLGLLKTHGIDVVSWVQRGLIDFVAPSNGWQTTWDVPYDEMRRELGEDVTIYGVIEDAPNWLNARDPRADKSSYRLLSTSGELLRGNAAGKLALGCDGIEQFNFFCSEEEIHNLGNPARITKYPALRGIDQLDQLRGKDKHYALASIWGYFMFPLWEYAEQVPAILEPDWRKAFRLSMCREPAGMEATVQLVVEKKDALPDLGVMFNGSWPNFHAARTDELVVPTGPFTHHIGENTAFNYTFDGAVIREGWNEIIVTNGSHQKASPQERVKNSVNIQSVEIAVRKK